MKLNLNSILFILGGVGIFAPDVLGLAVYLSSLHLAFLVPVVKVLGWLATAMGGLAIAIPRLRAKLAALGLATPPGAQAPWIEGKDAVVPLVQAPLPDQGAEPHSIPLYTTSSEDAKTPVVTKITRLKPPTV